MRTDKPISLRLAERELLAAQSSKRTNSTLGKKFERSKTNASSAVLLSLRAPLKHREVKTKGQFEGLSSGSYAFVKLTTCFF